MIYQQQKPLLGELPDWTRFPRPVGLWVMNESSGSIIKDLSGNRNTGILEGDTHWVGSALSFDGTGDWVVTSKGSSYDLGIRQNATYCVWIKPANVTGNKDIISDFNNVVGMTLRCSGDDLLAYVYPNNHRITKADVITTDWQFVCMTMDANVNIYHNGIFQGSVALGEDIGDGGTLRIGSNAVGGNPFVGLIGYASVFSRALSAAEIALLYYNPFPWFVEDEVSHLYVPGAPPAGSPYYYREFANRRVA